MERRTGEDCEPMLGVFAGAEWGPCTKKNTVGVTLHDKKKPEGVS